MTTRRQFLQAGMLGAGAATLTPKLFADSPKHGPPTRFIFVHKGNGLFPHAMVPPSLDAAEQEKERKKQPFEVSLVNHELPAWMNPLAEHREHLTILQGLSGKMCTTGHHTWQSSLGVYKANERLSSIKWATVDFELAKLFPSPFEHIELACFPDSGGNARGNIDGIEMGFSARGPQQPNYAFGSPAVAIRELFKSVSDQQADQIQYELERQVLAFTAEGQSQLGQQLRGAERAKVLNYAEAVEAIRLRNRKVDAMGDRLARHRPELGAEFFADNLSTTLRQAGHIEILLSTLISGMTNVVTLTIDELGTRYTGIPTIENELVNLHDVGHGKGVGSLKAEEVREKLRTYHMTLLDRIVKRLQRVPEGEGTLFDHTVLLYFPDNGETHHSHGVEWPFIVLAGDQVRLNISGKYIRLPHYGQPGHKTLGNWYTTILNAYGNPIEHYGDQDPGLNKSGFDQTGPIREFLG